MPELNITSKSKVTAWRYFPCTSVSSACLIAIIRAVAGYNINNHNLLKLLHISQLFTGDLAKIFSLDSQRSKDLFDVLRHGYVNVRYKDRYEPGPQDVQALMPVIKEFMDSVGRLYQQHTLVSEL